MVKIRKRGRKGLLSEINIIPFTDVVLVILIVFMITTPMLVQSSIKVNLPETSLDSPREVAKAIEITVKEDGSLFLNDEHILNVQELEQKLLSKAIRNNPVIVKGDKLSNYGVVAQVLAIAQKLGAASLDLQVQYKQEVVKP